MMMLNAFGRDRSLGLAVASVRDYREAARRRLPRQMFDYIDGGAYEEATLAANTADLEAISLRQRVMRDVSMRSMSTTVLGERLELPVILAPVGLAGMFAARAEVQAARAAERAGVSFVESTVSICSVEEVAQATERPPWFQLYVMRDRSYAEALMARAQAVGCRVLVLTADLAVVGARYRDTRNGLGGDISALGKAVRGIDRVRHLRWVRDVGLGGRPHTFGNLTDAVPGATSPDDFRTWVDAQFDPSVTWDDLAWVAGPSCAASRSRATVSASFASNPSEARALISIAVGAGRPVPGRRLEVALIRRPWQKEVADSRHRPDRRR